ncbi:MAG: hypothetical protein BJ554DRAFT_7840 [Olpidium bornovanus]|uniref:Lipase-like C-terminal domain-containing protein n=1 Tax=Olpidium bornovanus TaxID=278681 RepID=A0A8H8DJI2_9FUNG|nr:MAG: hypothetical protein BJ554DRAFT_7840 [Olpidium bornovanus]
MSLSMSRDVPCRCCGGAEPVPVVFVEGFMGRGTSGYWGDVDRYNRSRTRCCRRAARKRRLLFVHLGSVSSLHDRACELFYQITGGTVDYGELHSKIHGHGRYGRTHGGRRCSKNPALLRSPASFYRCCRSLNDPVGGSKLKLVSLSRTLPPVVQQTPAALRRPQLRWRYHMARRAAAEGAEFVGGKDEGDWVRSLTGISAPFRGTPAAHILGEKEDEPAKVHLLSFGSALYRLVHLYLYADFPAWIKAYLYDFNVDHWGFGRNGSAETGKTSFSELLGNLACSKWAEGRDCAPYDLTPRRMAWVNRRSALCGKTYYQSFAASMTEVDSKSGFHLPMIHGVLPLTVLSYFVGRYSPSSQKLVNEVSGAAEYAGGESDEPHWRLERTGEQAARGGTRPVHLPPGRRYDPSEWWENDGVCPLASQLHPGMCAEGYCTCGGEQSAAPGVWSAHVLQSTSHVDVVPNVRGLLRRPPPPPRVAESKASPAAATGLFGRLISALAARLSRQPSSDGAGEASRTRRARRDSAFASAPDEVGGGVSGAAEKPSDDEAGAVGQPSGSSSKHARVFRHIFGWLDTVDDDAEERRAAPPSGNHCSPPGR